MTRNWRQRLARRLRRWALTPDACYDEERRLPRREALRGVTVFSASLPKRDLSEPTEAELWSGEARRRLEKFGEPPHLT